VSGGFATLAGFDTLAAHSIVTRASIQQQHSIITASIQGVTASSSLVFVSSHRIAHAAKGSERRDTKPSSAKAKRASD
jgi:hypothetical protein